MIDSNSFDNTGMSADQRQQLDIALRYLQRDPNAAAIINQAAESDVKIALNDYGRNEYDSFMKVVSWDPSVAQEIIERNSKSSEGYISPALILLHELAHAIDRNGENPISYEGSNFPRACSHLALHQIKIQASRSMAL